MAANQSATDVKRGLSLNLGWLRSVYHLKFTEKCEMCLENQVLVKIYTQMVST